MVWRARVVESDLGDGSGDRSMERDCGSTEELSPSVSLPSSVRRKPFAQLEGVRLMRSNRLSAKS